jgi:polar amino acid transport system substrate-binding protein
MPYFDQFIQKFLAGLRSLVELKFLRLPRFNRLGWVFSISTLLVIGLTTGGVAQETPKNLVMFTSPDYPPYEFYDTKAGGGKGEIIGFDIDIANAIAKALKFKLTVMESDFDGLIPALQSKRADFVMSGMTPTPERKQNVDFSIIYYDAKDTIVAPKGSNLKQPKDLANKQVGAQLGSIQEKNLTEIAKTVKGIQPKLLNQIPDLVQELRSNRIEAAIIEDTVAKGLVAANPDLEFNSIPSEGPSGSAVAFPKGSPLVGSFNAVLQQMKTSGELDRLATRWFSTNLATAAATSATTTSEKPRGLDFSRIAPDLPFILAGVPVTLLFTLSSVFLGLIWGTLLSLGKISGIKPLQWLATAYTSIFRGTPLLLQLSLLYYATPQLTGYNITPLQAGVATFTLNSGAYMSETIRGGIQAVDRGQTEAAKALGISYGIMLVDIILPQALKNILPALVNETVSLLKDSSLVSTIGVVEILRAARIVQANKYIAFEPLLFAGLLYYILVMVLAFSASVLERRLRRSD